MFHSLSINMHAYILLSDTRSIRIGPSSHDLYAIRALDQPLQRNTATHAVISDNSSDFDALEPPSEQKL